MTKSPCLKGPSLSPLSVQGYQYQWKKVMRVPQTSLTTAANTAASLRKRAASSYRPNSWYWAADVSRSVSSPVKNDRNLALFEFPPDDIAGTEASDRAGDWPLAEQLTTTSFAQSPG
jgi:hypothetical protein